MVFGGQARITGFQRLRGRHPLIDSERAWVKSVDVLSAGADFQIGERVHVKVQKKHRRAGDIIQTQLCQRQRCDAVARRP